MAFRVSASTCKAFGASGCAAGGTGDSGKERSGFGSPAYAGVWHPVAAMAMIASVAMVFMCGSPEKLGRPLHYATGRRRECIIYP